MEKNMKNYIDLTPLPAEARIEVIYFYKYLLKKYNIERNKEINKNIGKQTKNTYTDKELTEIFNWDPLLGEEWDGFHLASGLSSADLKK